MYYLLINANVLVVDLDKIINALSNLLYDLVISRRHQVSKAIYSGSNQFLKGKIVDDEAKCNMPWMCLRLKDSTSKI